MKISDVVYKTVKEVDEMERFDFYSPPKKAKWYLQVLAWILSFPETFVVGAKIKKTGMKGIKGGYILLCNHNSFLDFKVATKAVFPRRSTYIVAIDGFINRENIMRNVGCFGKRKFINDANLYKNIKYSLNDLGVIVQLYAEARYSLCGTTAILPDSIGKLIKKLEHPVAMLLSHGHHLRQPFWNLKKRKIKTRSELTLLLTKEDVKHKTVDEINAIVRDAFQYDDYQFQLDNNIKIKEPFRAEGLHKVLYKCPHCHKDFTIKSKDHVLYCEACGANYEMSELGTLSCTNKETLFTHIPQWFEWIREQVKLEIERGEYNVALEVIVESLPNSTGYYRLGNGTLTHNKQGFHLYVETKDGVLDLKKPVLANYSVHIEYDYFGKGDCLSFSTNNDTYYIYPVNQTYSVTKFHFAVEELYKQLK